MSDVKLTPVEREKIEHALGAPKNYRNHYVTDPESPDGRIWEGMVARGLATVSRPVDWMGGMVVYRVTAAGCEALIAQDGAK